MPESTYLLQATGLSKSYFQRHAWGRRAQIKALDHVDITLPRGKTVGIIGKSGSGKSTLAMCLALLEELDAGAITFEDRRVQTLDRSNRRAIRRQIQIIFQSSVMALSPRCTVIELIEEPLLLQGHLPAHQRLQTVSSLLEQVGLPKELYHRRSHELSGGQRQRVAIARSLALNPMLLILDEPFVGLDSPIRNQIVNLLVELQDTRKLTYLYISHNLELVRYFADITLIMDHGKLAAMDDMRLPN